MDVIHKFRDEEQEHHDTGLEHGAEQAPFYKLMTDVIKVGCKVAIGVAKVVWRFLPNPSSEHFVKCGLSSRFQVKVAFEVCF